MQKLKTIDVLCSGGKYPIYVGPGLLDDSSLLIKHIRAKQVLIVSNSTIAPLYIDKIMSALSGFQTDKILLADGEQYKSLEAWEKILDTLATNHHHRDTTLIALGGGVVGDITGFASACYQRGVNFIQIPTTLLAQVDASIGGKTAVNHPQGKNLIGVFHQPVAVIIDVNTLATLPAREFHAGLAEIIKAALIKDKKFFHFLENNLQQLLKRDQQTLMQTIEQACLIKRDVVAEDEKEHGVRAILNFGHTFAHAIEKVLGYGEWLHGEAVALGIILAADLSEQINLLPKKDFTRIKNIIHSAQLPQKLPPNCDIKQLYYAMKSDKKILSNQIRLILLKNIGEATIISDIPEQKILSLLQRYSSN